MQLPRPRFSRRNGPPRTRLSALLRQVLQDAGDNIRVADIAMIFGDRAFGALLFLLAAPNLVPLPPGSSAVLGAPLILIAGQLALGRRVLWLPDFVGRRTIRKADYERALAYGLPYLRRTERLMMPRLTFMFGPLGDRLIGLTCLLLAIILFLPIPFANMVPALSIASFALALMQRDGIFAIIGWATAVVSFGIVAVISGALWIATKAFFRALGHSISGSGV
ncbi:exopolysaccharide biosynthesis protein [Propylenella binzhouense]|uniref:Exopolysaccharide biosynthesis protein n=1 Tax=Propylenella binzhouense TaxID=2555902 RepID=A0A964T3C6_9HYPH|nr:exopolysaccharide biosynthesis protein [Propylenella binzhouense]MYZ47708.1 exopolysaccharide biosynthesis protein [Propylenella binzhouense]